MERNSLISCLVICLLWLAIFFAVEGSKSTEQFRGRMWCVARVATPDRQLQRFLDFACGRLDCSQIRPGGICYEPNTLANHASYALDLYYRVHGVCDARIGTPSITDPSFGRCHYP